MIRTLITMLAGALILFLIAYGLGCNRGKTIIQKEYIAQITHDTIRDTVYVRKLIPYYVDKTNPEDLVRKGIDSNSKDWILTHNLFPNQKLMIIVL